MPLSREATCDICGDPAVKANLKRVTTIANTEIELHLILSSRRYLCQTHWLMALSQAINEAQNELP